MDTYEMQALNLESTVPSPLNTPSTTYGTSLDNLSPRLPGVNVRIALLLGVHMSTNADNFFFRL